MDLINALFESFGGLFVSLSCVRIYRDKQVHGVSMWHAFFFLAWGIWNLAYYPHLGQTWSFYGGIGVVTTNAIWVAMMVYYRYLKPSWGAVS